MTKPPFLLLMPALFSGLASPVACALGLTELEQRLAAHAPSVAFQQQETRIAQSRLTQRQAESGWRLFGSVSGGRTHEIATADSTRSYSNHGYTVGASYPLLGSRSQQRLREVEAQQETVAAGARAALALDEARTRLRRAYVALWQAREQKRLAEAFLSDAVQARQVLGERQKAGLVLPSDAQTAQSWYTLAENRRQAALRSEQVLLAELSLLTGLSPSGLEPLEPPRLAADLKRPANSETTATALARLGLEAEQARIRAQKAPGIEAALTVSVSNSRESWASDQTGRAVQAGINFSLPFELGRLRSAVAEESAARLEQARLGYDLARQQSTQGRSEAEAAYVSALADTEYAREQEAAAARAVTERRLRRALIAGDVQEQLYRARFNYYQAAQQRLEQWARLQNAAVDLARFGYPLVPTPLPLPDRMASTLQEAPAAAPSLAARTQPVAQTAAGLAVTSGAYLWNSHSTLADPDAAVMAWQAAGISRILLGLDGSQLAEAELPVRLQALLDTAHARGVKVSLLLGDADWMTLQERPRLLALIRQLAPLPFDGLNLDLEVEQSKGWPEERAALRQMWLDTLRAAAAVSPWPLAATFHHRHLDSPDLADALRAAGVQEACVMIFSSRHATVLATERKAFQSLAGLPYSLVVSAEPALPVSESFATLGRQQIATLAQALLRQRGAAAPALYFQTWQDYQGLK